MQITLAPGQCADVRAVEAIQLPSDQRIVADKGYDSDAFRQQIVAKGSQPCIPPRENRVTPSRWRRGFYAQRHQVENFFQRIKGLRRIGTR